MKFITNLKNIYWWSRGELCVWMRFFVNLLPGTIGCTIRRVYLPRSFEYCGKRIILHRNFRVNNPSLFSVGDHFLANENCYINAGGRVVIGDDVMLGPDVKIWSVNHSFDNQSRAFNRQGYSYSQVKIGNNVWIGANVFIAPGVDICDNVVVGAGAVVTKSIHSSYSMVAGNPAVVVKKLGVGR